MTTVYSSTYLTVWLISKHCAKWTLSYRAWRSVSHRNFIRYPLGLCFALFCFEKIIYQHVAYVLKVQRFAKKGHLAQQHLTSLHLSFRNVPQIQLSV